MTPEDATFDDYIEAIEVCLTARGDALSAACDALQAIEAAHPDYQGRAAKGEGRDEAAEEAAAK